MDRTPYQENIIKRYYENKPEIMLQKLSELATELYLAETPKKRAQRICIAQVDTLSYLIVATEGPENKGSVGLTLIEFAELVRDLGAKQAYNLDGGSSASLVMNYKKINALSTGKKRSVSDAICFVTAVPGR